MFRIDSEGVSFGSGRSNRRGQGSWEDFAAEFADMGMRMAGGRRQRRRRHGGAPHQRRMLKQGELPILILALIENEPMHGYALIEEIESRTGGTYAPSPGIMYPSLTLIADMGLAEEQADGSRKMYAITDKGREHLEEKRDEADDILARLDEAGGKRAETPDMAPIGRAAMNLGAAVKLRVWDGKADREEARRIADVLDAAARKIEDG
ncbi:MAG: PadR family transcriptional regulator [Pacificimonas sp.]